MANGYFGGLLTDTFSLNPQAVSNLIDKADQWIDEKIEQLPSRRAREAAHSLKKLPDTVAAAALTRANPTVGGGLAAAATSKCWSANTFSRLSADSSLVQAGQTAVAALEDCLGWGAVVRASGRDLYTGAKLSKPDTEKAQGRLLGGLTHLAVAGAVIGAPAGTQKPPRRSTPAYEVTEKGLARVEEHLDAVLRDQFPEFRRSDQLALQAGERGMLERLRSGARTTQDMEFYLHELKESAGFRTTGDLISSHNEALQWRGVSSEDLFHPDVVEAHPEFFPRHQE